MLLMGLFSSRKTWKKKKSAVVENELKDLSVLGKYLATKLYSQSSWIIIEKKNMPVNQCS